MVSGPAYDKAIDRYSPLVNAKYYRKLSVFIKKLTLCKEKFTSTSTSTRAPVFRVPNECFTTKLWKMIEYFFLEVRIWWTASSRQRGIFVPTKSASSTRFLSCINKYRISSTVYVAIWCPDVIFEQLADCCICPSNSETGNILLFLGSVNALVFSLSPKSCTCTAVCVWGYSAIIYSQIYFLKSFYLLLLNILKNKIIK